MPKYTPGPWWQDDDGFIAAGHGDNYVTVADADCSSMDIDEREANKDLIVVAPDLFEFVEHIARMTQDGEEVDGEEFVMENDDAVCTLNILIEQARELAKEVE